MTVDGLALHSFGAAASAVMTIAAALTAHIDDMMDHSNVHPPEVDSHPSPNPPKAVNPSLLPPMSLPALSRAYHADSPPPASSACLILDLNSDQPLPASLKFDDLPLLVQHQLIVARCLAAQPDGPPGLSIVHLPYQPDASFDPLEFGDFHVPFTLYERNHLLPLAVHLESTTEPDQKLRVPVKRLPNLPLRSRDDILRALSDLVEDAAAHIHFTVPPGRVKRMRPPSRHWHTAPTNQRDPGNPPVHRSFRYVQVDPDHPPLAGRFVADATEATVVRDNRVIVGAKDGAATLVDAVTGEILHEWSPVAHPLELGVYDFAAYAVKDVVVHHIQNHISAAAYLDGSIAFFDTERFGTFVFPLRLPGPAMRIVFGHGASNNYLFVGTARRTQSHRRDAMPAGIYCVNWARGEFEPPAEIPPRPHFPVKNCDVAGLALNPTGDLLVAVTYSNLTRARGTA
ncbi:hypothetical protein AMAG_11334 [Allomyces macrogynus ATCC 38327]|uniref:Uncharacterized protein n=1 Tax=Allomyces macrogynus (strain ATCC 38327) TaxID=578462 RepID=A0A0L0SWW6_ALLM3|nr:hypothetical protein AMAG_11334 [Allomyces macrogynus ATCC 38327]|eukprot:KNE66854.1 hypothetical protein AMAG_11334 [Allomyces macrogynus ATCC 38327]